jgi:hypothetical protein
MKQNHRSWLKREHNMDTCIQIQNDKEEECKVCRNKSCAMKKEEELQWEEEVLSA